MRWSTLCVPLYALMLVSSHPSTAQESLKFSELWTPVDIKAPAYPVEHGISGTQGCATVRFLVNSKGRPVSVQVVASHPNPDFGESLGKAVRKWRYEPTEANPDRQSARAQQTLTFKLEDSDGGTSGPSRAELRQQCRDIVAKARAKKAADS